MSFFAHLETRAVLRLSGEDVRHFLQNLITADLEVVDAKGSGFAALLTPQGKILFDFFLLSVDGGYLLDAPKDVAADLLKRLIFYKLRAKVEITDVSDTHVVFASWGERSVDNISALNMTDPRVAALGTRFYGTADTISAELLAAGLERADSAAYTAHRILLGVPESLSDFDFSTIFPHDANMDALNGVSFSKGCYVGQEVVSRVHHRGTARKRFIKVSSSSPLPEAGSDLEMDGKSVGTLHSSTEAGGAYHGIALVRLDKVADGLSRSHAIRCGESDVEVAIPDWANFTWPESDPD